MAKTSVLISSLAVVAVVGVAYWVLSPNEILVPIPTPNEDNQNKNPNAIANQWQWENFTDTKQTSEPVSDGKSARADKPPVTGEVNYNVVGIYNVLQSIQLDANGRVVPDQTAKEALEQGFLELGPNLSPEAIAELQDLIRIGLPGQAGEEAARILQNYYQFRLAEEEFNQYLPQDGQLPTTDDYEKLVQLRRSFLGAEVADKLFAVEDAQARHMFAAIALQRDADLTDEERQAKQQALQEKLNDSLLNLGQLDPEDAAAEKVERLRREGASSADIYATRVDILGAERASELAAADREEAQWESRFNRFWQARQHVMQAGLEEAESERQIEQLLSQYFSPDERERARVTSFDWQARGSE